MRACPVPRVTIKIAQTLDGRIATANGRSQWITGEAARARGHALRATHDAILVGIGTVLADNPRLTVRHTAGTHPRRIIVDSELRLPLDAAVLAGAGSAPVVLTRVQASDERASRLAESGVEIETVPGATGRVDLTRGLELLYERGIRTLLVEGGAAITTELIRLRHCDAFAIFLAPRLLGTGVNSIGDLGATSVSDAVHLSVTDLEMLGEDIYLRATPEWPD